MSPIVTILLYGVIPIAALLLVAVLTMARRPSGGTRWRSGQDWDHEPSWWVGNPRGSGVSVPDGMTTSTTRTARGGARGTW